MRRSALPVAILLAGFASPAAAAQWWSLGLAEAPGVPRSISFIDADSVRPFGPALAGEVYAVWETPVRGVKVVKARVLFHCAQGTMQIRERTMLDERGRKLRAIVEGPMPAASPEGSISGDLAQFACATPAARRGNPNATPLGAHRPDDFAAETFKARR